MSGRVRHLRQFFGYVLTGGLAAVVDIGGFHLLLPHSGGVLPAAITSFVLAAAVNYTLSSAWVWRSDWRDARRASLFLLFACVGLAINASVTWTLASTLPIPPTLAKLGGVAVAFGANYVMNSLIVFRAADRVLDRTP